MQFFTFYKTKFTTIEDLLFDQILFYILPFTDPCFLVLIQRAPVLPVSFRGTLPLLQCHYDKATAASVLLHGRLKQLKAHRDTQTQSFFECRLSRKITRKETRPVASGQGLRLAVWPRKRFRSAESWTVSLESTVLLYSPPTQAAGGLVTAAFLRELDRKR